MVRRQKKSEESEFEVQEIISHRTIKGRREYKIRWKGYSASEDTWEVEDNLNCHTLIEEYQANLDNSEELEEGSSKQSGRRKRKNGQGDAEDNSKDEKEGGQSEGDDQPAEKTPKKTPRQSKDKSSKGTKKESEGSPSQGSRRSLRSPPAKKEAKTPPQPTKKSTKKQTPEKKTARKTKDKEYEVEKIEKMKIGRNGKRTFLVHWVGYDESDATWEPEDHLKGTDLLEKFLKTQE